MRDPVNQAHECVYADVKFRSKHEAAWASYFDSMHVDWRYEQLQFRGRALGRYTPDFHLPDFDAVLEVKPSDRGIRDAERMKPDRLAVMVGAPRVWMSYGFPPYFEQIAGAGHRKLEVARFVNDRELKSTLRAGKTLMEGVWLVGACAPDVRKTLTMEQLTVSAFVTLTEPLLPDDDFLSTCAIDAAQRVRSQELVSTKTYYDRWIRNGFVRDGHPSRVVFDPSEERRSARRA